MNILVSSGTIPSNWGTQTSAENIKIQNYNLWTALNVFQYGTNQQLQIENTECHNPLHPMGGMAKLHRTRSLQREANRK